MAVITTRGLRIHALSLAWHQSRSRQDLLNILALLIVLAGAILFIIPFVWMISSSLKEQRDVFNPNWIPSPVAWSNYPEALTSAPFDLYFKNTVVMVVPRVLGDVVSSALVAYSFARLKWPGRDLWFGVVLATLMLPGIVTLVPKYVLFAKIGWVDTFLPLIVPAWLGANATFIFLLRQFYKGIPMELTEAARIDGAGELRIFWQVISPLVKPALAYTTIVSFTQAWQDYMGPLIYLNSEDNYVLQLGLTAFKAGGGGIPQWHYLMAVSLLVMLPVLVLFFVGQRYFIEGVQLTGLKG